jgi:hypothetical protein
MGRVLTANMGGTASHEGCVGCVNRFVSCEKIVLKAFVEVRYDGLVPLSSGMGIRIPINSTPAFIEETTNGLFRFHLPD